MKIQRISCFDTTNKLMAFFISVALMSFLFSGCGGPSYPPEPDSQVDAHNGIATALVFLTVMAVMFVTIMLRKKVFSLSYFPNSTLGIFGLLSLLIVTMFASIFVSHQVHCCRKEGCCSVPGCVEHTVYRGLQSRYHNGKRVYDSEEENVYDSKIPKISNRRSCKNKKSCRHDRIEYN